MQPLADKIRPTTFKDIIGQDHLVGPRGVITKMVENDNLHTMILYGPPSSGKTTIALILKEHFKGFIFNASNSKKSELQKIINDNPKPIVLIIDEIHRMKTDTQDFLLSYIEDGTVIMIGLTTHNPYYKVNPAIRSRSLLLKMHDTSKDDILNILKYAVKKEKYPYKITDEVYEYLCDSSGREVRTALNFLDILMSKKQDIDLESAKELVFSPNLRLDANNDHYYDLLSGLQKSIRGSDVDAALYYSAKLVAEGDLDSLVRRLLVIAYEDIGIANKSACDFTYNALMAAQVVGLPEARIMIGDIVVVLALSPKSNLGHQALDNALNDIEQNANDYPLPNHLKNKRLYKYPHNYPHAMVKQSYLPKEILDHVYFHPKDNSKEEIKLKEIYHKVKEAKK